MRTLSIFLASKPFEWAVSGVILLYALVLGSESLVDHASPLGRTLVLLERSILLLLCVEVGLRTVNAVWSALRTQNLDSDNELRSAWFHFDVVTTILGFIPGFEAFRAYRLLRLIGRFEFFKHPIELLFRALKRSLSLAALAGFLIAVNGLVSSKAFGVSFPEEFGRVDLAILSSLFLVFFDDLGNIYLAMYTANPLAMILHVIVTLLVGVLLMALFVSTVLDVRDQLKKEHEEEAKR